MVCKTIIHNEVTSWPYGTVIIQNRVYIYMLENKNTLTPIRIGLLKNGVSASDVSTNEHSTTFGSPRIALHKEFINLAAA